MFEKRPTPELEKHLSIKIVIEGAKKKELKKKKRLMQQGAGGPGDRAAKTKKARVTQKKRAKSCDVPGGATGFPRRIVFKNPGSGKKDTKSQNPWHTPTPRGKQKGRKPRNRRKTESVPRKRRQGAGPQKKKKQALKREHRVKRQDRKKEIQSPENSSEYTKKQWVPGTTQPGRVGSRLTSGGLYGGTKTTKSTSRTPIEKKECEKRRTNPEPGPLNHELRLGAKKRRAKKGNWAKNARGQWVEFRRV